MDTLQWLSCALGMSGALTNCLGGKLLRWTWPAWLMSNMFSLVVLLHLHATGLVAQQAFYTITTVLGGFREFYPRAWQRCGLTLRRSKQLQR